MTAYAITLGARTTVPVTWASQDGHTVTAQMPTGLHAAYASESHVAAVTQLADTTQVGPAVNQAGIGTVGLSGGALVGLGILVWFAARWKHHDKPVRKAFVMGAIATALVGSWGLFGTLTNTVRSTGDSVGTSVGSTIGQQTSVSR